MKVMSQRQQCFGRESNPRLPRKRGFKLIGCCCHTGPRVPGESSAAEPPTRVGSDISLTGRGRSFTLYWRWTLFGSLELLCKWCNLSSRKICNPKI